MDPSKHMFNEYGWKIVGAIVPTDDNSRADNNIPFLIFVKWSKEWVETRVVSLGRNQSQESDRKGVLYSVQNLAQQEAGLIFEFE